ncbi:hypothetical protein [Paenibacillus gansuensis]|uniref:Uncharacterized protein n=1 Tax=Paenibacillus gansuensis TaxID=306542 RepID=A0ABW5PIM7_9BACL
MNAQMMDQIFVESYMMMNLEITFAGVRNWFELAETSIDDAALFGALLFPEQIPSDFRSEFARMILYRHEDMYFQASRTHHSIGTEDPIRDTSEPVHQLLVRLMNVRSLHGNENALIDLGVALHKDKALNVPLYQSLHRYFQMNA